MSLILYQDDFHRIEQHIAQNGESNRVACTFTPFNFYTIDNEGFGVNFMLSRGYDVIAFKCINDSWFQQIPPEVYNDIGKITRRYRDVVTYGSSMGGYAAIVFSKRLNAKSIISISPQFSIDSPSDRRWAAQAEKITWQYRMEPEHISASSMSLIYDDHMALEVAHIDQIVKSSYNVDKINHFRFPLSGHPTGAFLAQTGLISSIVSDILSGRITEAPNIGWKHIRKSSAYFLSLSQIARSRGREKLEILALENALRLRPDHALVQNLLHHAQARSTSRTETGSS